MDKSKSAKNETSAKYDFDVLIIGAGPAGLSAAHELAEKKLKIGIIEAAPFIGGKTISAYGYPWEPPPTTTGKLKSYLNSEPEIAKISQQLPMEHGFRFYPGNYINLTSIMDRIPGPDGTGTVTQCLTTDLGPAKYLNKIPKNKTFYARFKAKMEMMFFGLALYVPFFLTPKRAMKYDDISVEELFNLKNRSPEVRNMILRLADSLCSGMLSRASSLAVVNILLNYITSPGNTAIRTFNRPTHCAWLEPWYKYLTSLKVKFFLNTKMIRFDVQEIATSDKDLPKAKIYEVIAFDTAKNKAITFNAKFIILAIPVDAVMNIIKQNYEYLRYEPRLLNLFKIDTLPATGIQLYYETPIKGFEKQIVGFTMSDHPWGLSYVDQASYWVTPQKYAGNYGVISIYVSITNQRGINIQKSVLQASPNELAYEMFCEVEQEFKKRGVKIPKRIGFSSHFYNCYLPEKKLKDCKMNYHLNSTIDQDQLHLATVGMWKWRPRPEDIYFDKLILCGAYAQNNTFYVSTMESACESGRRAANTILKEYKLAPVEIYNVSLPKVVRVSRFLDKLIYAIWLPNPFDVLLTILRKTLKTNDVHMDPAVRKHENLHW